MSESSRLDFTGERVVPGLVDPNLFNEHLSRYRFAAQFASAGARVLDAGCGAGYGSAELGAQASVVGIDVAKEAVANARAEYGRSNICFTQASCDTIPFADASFDLVVAFEVIEHLERWQDLLREACRVLKPTGLLVVSTPNKSYYAETRKDAGPNPYHVHEFEYDEFRLALSDVFPHVRLWSQNHTEAVAFLPLEDAPGRLDAPADKDPQTAHFFVAACSRSELPAASAYAWLPEAGNVLWERERHVALLEEEVAQKTAWLDEATAAHSKLKDEHEALLKELEQHNAWALKLNGEIAQARDAIARLEAELKSARDGAQQSIARLEGELAEARAGAQAGITRLEDELAAAHRNYGAKIAELEDEGRVRLAWAQDLQDQIARGNAEIQRRIAELAHERAMVEERTHWGEEKSREAEQARQRIAILEARVRALEDAGWVKLGARLGAVPK